MPKQVVLVVDDEPTVLRVAGRLIDRLGYEALTASDGEQAIELLRQRDGEVSVVLLDLSMDGLSGPETFVRLRQIDRQVPVLLSSGTDEPQPLGAHEGAAPAGFLQKPYDMAQLQQALAGAIATGRDETG